MPSTAKILASALAGAVAVSAHGYATNIVVDGVYYAGFDVTSASYEANPPIVIGWGTSATDLGFVAPDAFGGPDIICHRDGKNAKGHAEVAAGSQIFIKWNTWPDSHKGPVLNYLANCGDAGCETVDKTTLKFFKIAEAGLIDGSSTPGVYAADQLIDNGLGWMVEIPSDIAPGNYVLRHEIIALHSGNQANGAQNYPQCFNLKVTGSGSSKPEGVLGTSLYKADDAGILFDIYKSVSTYPIPGPTMVAGATNVKQATSAVAKTGTAETGSGSGSSPSTAAGSSAPAATSSAAAAETTSSAAAVESTSAAAQPTSASQNSAATSAAQTSPSKPTKTASPGCKSKRSKKNKKRAQRA